MPGEATRRSTSIGDYLKSGWLYPLPQHAISRLVHRLARWQWRPWKRALIAGFRRRYAIDMSEAAEPAPAAYSDFNAFFTRRLRGDARPLASPSEAVLCPADGTVSQLGALREATLMQAKGRSFGLRALLGGDQALTDAFTGGNYVTVYLAPKDYHRVHMPRHGKLRQMLHVPGRLFSVAPHTVNSVPRLFTRNERVVTVFDGEHGPFAVILIGALCVGSIETLWSGEVTPPRARQLRHWRYREHGTTLARGDELGRFNMGSTVIALFPPGSVQWQPTLQAGARVVMGQQVGSVIATK